MEEPVIFSKISPDGTLATKQLAGGKHDKTRIPVEFAVKVTGAGKLPPRLVGKAANPGYFGRSGGEIRMAVDLIRRSG